MKNYRAIIVEDERLPRLSLIRKLEDYHPEISIVESCEDYSSALKAILRHRPDILFLDIQLQGHTTLELLRELKEAMPLPHIIFTTAYNNSEYLLQAIRFAAADYLLKPVDVSELAKAIRRIEERDERNALPAGKAFCRQSSSPNIERYAVHRQERHYLCACQRQLFAGHPDNGRGNCPGTPGHHRDPAGRSALHPSRTKPAAQSANDSQSRYPAQVVHPAHTRRTGVQHRPVSRRTGLGGEVHQAGK